jgi:peptide/nickel transport system permease protein
MILLRQSSIIAATVLAALLGLFAITYIIGPDPLGVDLGNLQAPPNLENWFGTDELGRSVLARLSAGAIFSIALMAISSIGAVALGTTLGIMSGWVGGVVDRVINLVIALFWSIPVAVFAILVLTILPVNLLSIILTIVAVNWVGSARVVRAQTIRLRQEPFVAAAKAYGFSERAIFASAVLPNLRALLALLVGFAAAESLALEGGLAYLGFSLPPPAASWGTMLANGLPYLASAWWIAAAPAAAMIFTIALARILSARLNDLIFR